MATANAGLDNEAITPEILIGRATDMIPMLRERATATDEARQMLVENLDAFQQAGFFRTVQPKRYGGFEFDFETVFKITIEVGAGCPAVPLGPPGWFQGTFWPEVTPGNCSAGPVAALCPGGGTLGPESCPGVGCTSGTSNGALSASGQGWGWSRQLQNRICVVFQARLIA